jgi:predicted dienelactone hydrolase
VSKRLRALTRAAFGSLLLFVSLSSYAADEVAARIGGVEVVLWTPSQGLLQDLPVLVFSHALYMCPTQSRYLTAALADAGYLVIAPRHSDSSCNFSVNPSMSRLGGKPSMFWTDDDYRDRADDIRAVVKALPDDPVYGGMADVQRLALVGHSLGGYTVLGLGGAWPSWQLKGVRAVAALTPYSLPFQRSDGLRHMTVPTMYQVGSLDPVFTMPIEHFAYESTPSPKYMVEMSWANHMAWTDFGMTSRDAILAYLIAFLNHYVRGTPETSALRLALPGVSEFRRD